MNVDQALSQAVAAYAARNPESRSRLEAAAAAMPGGNTRSVLFYDPFPLAFARGEGCRLFDADGHEYIDFLGEYTAGVYGHSDPTIRAAVAAALEGGVNLSGHNLLEADLARIVRERFPSLELVRFTNSGTEANLMALAAATAFTRRRKVLVFDGAYHGSVLNFVQGPSPVNVPHEFILSPYNDSAEALRRIGAHASDLAAILVEPMLGAGGCVPGDCEFLRVLRRGASQIGALLIFDEVMTSRLSPGGRQAALGIVPDLTTLGKYLGGGMTTGAFGGRREVMAQFDPRRPGSLAHAGTFNNNVVTMAAGIAGLAHVFTPAAAEALNARGDGLRERLNGLCRERGARFQFTGIGSLMTAHATDRPIRNRADVAAGDARVGGIFFFDLLRRGLYLARRGFIALSLPVGDAEIERLAAGVEGFLSDREELLR